VSSNELAQDHILLFQKITGWKLEDLELWWHVDQIILKRNESLRAACLSIGISNVFVVMAKAEPSVQFRLATIEP